MAPLRRDKLPESATVPGKQPDTREIQITECDKGGNPGTTGTKLIENDDCKIQVIQFPHFID